MGKRIWVQKTWTVDTPKLIGEVTPDATTWRWVVRGRYVRSIFAEGRCDSLASARAAVEAQLDRLGD